MSQGPNFIGWAQTGKVLFLCAFACYLLICVTMALLQRSFLYFPLILNSAQVDELARAAKLERWTDKTGENIGFKRLSPQQPAEGAVLIAHGNGGSAVGSAHYADDIQKVSALDVYILEYPGYEDRPGAPSQSSLFKAADDALQMLPSDKPVYIVGESLGAAVASYLAGAYPDRIAGMVLISPFNRLAPVAQMHYPILPVWLCLADRYPSEDYLRNYHGKIGITVGGLDTVVPPKFGLRLYNGYAGPKKLWQFPDGEHCQIMEPVPEFWKEAIAFWHKG